MLNCLQGKVVQTIEAYRNDTEWMLERSVKESSMTDSKRINRGPFKLKLGAITLFPFFKHVFSFQLFLLDDLQRLVCGHEVPVAVKLFYENDNSQLTDTSLFSLERGPIVIDKTGMATVNIKFNTLSMNHANKKFVLQFCAAFDRTRQRGKTTTNEIDLDYLSTVATVCTQPLQVVRNRLLVQTSVLGSDGEDKHDIWYKDEGGRENCIEMVVSLQDCDGRLVLNRSVPLVVVLIYDNGDVVAKQDFLHIQSDSVLCIQSSGKTTIKLRINDVSKNHQRQLFKIMVTPDTSSSPLLLDISGDQSSSIEVKSKRTAKRKVTPDASSVASHHLNSLSGVGGGLGGMGYGRSSSSGGGGNGNSSSAGLLYAEGVKQEYSAALEGAKLSYAAAAAYNGGSGVGSGAAGVQCLPTPRSASVMDTLLNSGGHQMNSIALLNNTSSGSIRDKDEAGAGGGGGGDDVIPLGDSIIVSDKAISAIVDWTSSVLTTLQSIKWKPIGFEQRPSDGFIDHSKPLHSITNPNAAIDQLLSEYALSDIGSTLTTLLMRVNDINGGGGAAGGVSSSGGRKRPKLSSISTAATASNNSNNLTTAAAMIQQQQQRLGSGVSFSKPSSRPTVSPRVIEEAAVGCYTSELETTAAAGKNQQQPQMDGESQVYYILASMQRTASCTAVEDCGFPAFDSDMQLVGYYQEKRNLLNNSTVVSFTPFSNNFTSQDRDNAETLLLAHIQTNSSAVYSLSRCNNDLQAMKHECLVHFWLSEVNLDEEAAAAAVGGGVGGLAAVAAAASTITAEQSEQERRH